jgi:hypothetical protein
VTSPTPPFYAALGLFGKRLATAGNETLAILRAHLRTRIATMTPHKISRVGERMRWQFR